MKQPKEYYSIASERGERMGAGSLEVRKSLGTLMSTLGEVVLAAPRN